MVSRSGKKRYDLLRQQRPALFENPVDAAYVILTEPHDVRLAEAQEADRLRRNGMPETWSNTGVVYEDGCLLVLRDAVRRPDGTLGTYIRTVSADCSRGVAILPLMDNQAILIRHFRHATRLTHLEIPRGFGRGGRTSAEQAVLELREEIGATVVELIELGSIHPNAGMSSDPADLFLARIREIGEPQRDEGISAIQAMSIPMLGEMIATGTITDGFTITAYARASLKGYL